MLLSGEGNRSKMRVRPVIKSSAVRTSGAKPEIICLWGKRRGSKGANGATPSNTDKGVRELSEWGYLTRDVDISRILDKVPRRFPGQLRLMTAYAAGALKLVGLCALQPSRVVYTSNYPWIRVVARLKRAGIIRNRLVIRWTANDVDYAQFESKDSKIVGDLGLTMAQVDACWLASLRERDVWRRRFPDLAYRFVFWPTPVDTEFYLQRKRPADRVRGQYVVAVGSDHKRDWATPIEMSRHGIPTILLTEDPRVQELLKASPSQFCRLEFKVGFEQSARILAEAGAIMLATLPNDRFSGSTTVGVAAALGQPLMIDEPYDLEAYGLVDGTNCARFTRADPTSAALAARRLLNDKVASDRMCAELEKLTRSLGIGPYAKQLELSLRSDWRGEEVCWTQTAI